MNGINLKSVLIDSSKSVRCNMPDIKENIKQELLKMIEEEKKAIYYRKIISDTLEEGFQITSEENFIEKLEMFAKSI